MKNIKIQNIILLILKLTIYFIFLYSLHTRAEFLKFSVYLSYSLHGEGLLTSIIHSMISVLIGYLCSRILCDINRLIHLFWEGGVNVRHVTVGCIPKVFFRIVLFEQTV